MIKKSTLWIITLLILASMILGACGGSATPTEPAEPAKTAEPAAPTEPAEPAKTEEPAETAVAASDRRRLVELCHRRPLRRDAGTTG